MPYRLRRAIESDLDDLDMMLNPDPHVLTDSASVETWRSRRL